MSFSFWRMAEDKIQKAKKDGEFDHLPGRGKPLKLKNDLGIPEELRMVYHVLQNAGYTDDEGHLKKELMTIEDLIKNCLDEEERKKLVKQQSEKLLKYNALLAEKRISTNSATFKNYQEKIEKKLL